MIFREGIRIRVNCPDLELFVDDITEYAIVKISRLRNGSFVLTLLKKKVRR